MSKKRKGFRLNFDSHRIAIAIITFALAVIFRLTTHDFFDLETINFNLGIVLSPFFALLIAQSLIEKKVDWREAFIFIIVMMVMMLGMDYLPALQPFDIFQIQLNDSLGVLFSGAIYIVIIPLSVIISDMITDRWNLKLSKR